MQSINKFSVRGRISIIVMAERPIHEDVGEISKRNELIEVEAFHEQSEDVLGTDALESLTGAIPIDESPLQALQLLIIFLAVRKRRPNRLYEGERLRPAHMSVSADHIGNHEAPPRNQRELYLVEYVLQFDNVVQRVMGHGRRIPARRAPLIDVDLSKQQAVAHVGVGRGLASAVKQDGRQFGAFNHDIHACPLESLRNIDLY